MREQSEGVPIVEDLVDLHEQMGLYTLIASLVATAAMTIAEAAAQRSKTDLDPILLRTALACLVFVAAALVAWTAHVGATMTWGVVAP